MTLPNRLSPAAADYLLTIADDEHMIGARHTSWIGMGPFLEEDLAFCSIAQDELGHAIALYRILTADQSITGVDVDTLALGRPAEEYRSSWLCEWPTDDWASALLRHWLYDLAEDGPSPARAQLNRALGELAPIADTLWLPPLLEAEAIGEGVAAITFAELGMTWHTKVQAELKRLGLDATITPGPQTSRSERSEYFAALHTDLNAVRSIDPTAIW